MSDITAIIWIIAALLGVICQLCFFIYQKENTNKHLLDLDKRLSYFISELQILRDDQDTINHWIFFDNYFDNEYQVRQYIESARWPNREAAHFAMKSIKKEI